MANTEFEFFNLKRTANKRKQQVKSAGRKEIRLTQKKHSKEAGGKKYYMLTYKY